MNKSSATNLAAALVIVAGYLISAYLDAAIGDRIQSVGFFALSGAITNWLAIYMLFDKVPGLYGSGVIPAHFEEIKAWIKDLVMQQFFSRENMDRYFLEGQEMFGDIIDIEAAADKLDYDRIFDTIKSEVLSSKFGGMLAMFGGAGMLEKYREPFALKVRTYIVDEVSSPDFITSILDGSAPDIGGAISAKVEIIVQARLDELTPQLVKELVQEMIRKHLGWLVVWGGVFGGLIGLVMGFVR